MKRSGFTMIELVFIIVILGILGAIAVPKMAANRENAALVTLKNDMATILQAVPAYAMAHGAYDSNGKLMWLGDAAVIKPGIWRVGKNASKALHAEDNENDLQKVRNLESIFPDKNDHCASLRIVESRDGGALEVQEAGYSGDGLREHGPFLEYWISKRGECAILRNQPTGTAADRNILEYIPLSGQPVKH